jgi:ParB family transcriptional regulator, chromosome partitioning protein
MAKGLGKGLGSLIPNTKVPAPKSSSAPVVQAAPVEVDEKNRVLQVTLDKVQPNPDQPRKHFDHQALEELTNSIKEHGILQPLIVMPSTPNGKHVLIAGERRLRASELAGLKKVPVIVREVDEHQRMALAIVENVQRHDLNPIEEAIAYQRLMDDFNITQDEVSKKMGKSRSSIANTLRLLVLPEAVQTIVAEGKMSMGHAKVLAGLDSTEEQAKYAKEVLDNKMTVRQLEDATRTSRKISKPSNKSFDPVREAQEEMMRERLGTKVAIKKSGEKGQIQIHFYSMEELQRLLNELS